MLLCVGQLHELPPCFQISFFFFFQIQSSYFSGGLDSSERWYLVSIQCLVKEETESVKEKKMHTFPIAENGSIVPHRHTKGFLELSFDKVPGERLMSAGRGLQVAVPRMTSSLPSPCQSSIVPTCNPHPGNSSSGCFLSKQSKSCQCQLGVATFYKLYARVTIPDFFP